MLKDRPPRLGEWLLKRFLLADECHEKLGDFEEGYHIKAREKGKHKAFAWYWLQLIITIPVFVKNLFYWRLIMLNNYLKIALRNVKRHKGYSLINISGLAIGLTTFILISLYVQYELSYDRYHENSDRIFRVIQYQPQEKTYGKSDFFAFTHSPLGQTLVDRYPEVINATRIMKKYHDILITYKDYSDIENGIYFADPEFFNIFSFELLKGSPKTVLAEPNSIVLSDKMARKYFGREDPIGKIINNGSDEYFVTGVMKNFPENSHFMMDFIIPFEKCLELWPPRGDGWRNRWYCYTYCLLEKGTDPKELENKLVSLRKEISKEKDSKSKFVLQPMIDIHLYSKITGELSNNNEAKYIYMFSTIAFLILIIACINYMNLVTARSTQRGREVGIRKVVGAQRQQLIRQYIGESLFFTILAFVLSVLIVWTVVPVFSSLMGRNLTISLFSNISFGLFLFMSIMITGIISGSYPAFYISSFQPVTVLKGRLSTTAQGKTLRNVLVVFQFSISIVLIICALAVRGQLDFIQNTNVGYDKDQIVIFKLRDQEALGKSEVIMTELLKNPHILKVSSSGHLPNRITGIGRFKFPDHPDDKDTELKFGWIDHNFMDLYNIKLVSGRNFSRDFPTDAEGAIIVNEVAVKRFGWDEPLGKELKSGKNIYKVIGVVKDFNFESLHNEIDPLGLFNTSYPYHISVKIDGNNIPKTLTFLESQMNKFSPKYPFEFSFFDEEFAMAYRTEQKLGEMFNTFTLIAIFISCLGLLGLATFTAEQRTKEIGIRKVLGATKFRIILLLSNELVKWILISNAIALPIGYNIMSKWLKNFAYRIDLGVEIFILSSLAALCIALLTVSFQTLRAATSNPVDSLRYE